MIPISTTTISVLRVPADPLRDPYDPEPAAEVVERGVRANIASPNGRERIVGGDQEIIEFRLNCDPVDLRHTDRVEDEKTGEIYEVRWAHPRIGFGRDHMTAGLRQVTGIVSRAS